MRLPARIDHGPGPGGRVRTATGAGLLRSVLLAGALIISGEAGAVHSEIEPFTVRNYTVADGLPQSQVRAIHQDRHGYLWIGTQGGAGRYNGREFDRFSSPDGLAGNQIDAIASDPDGGVWLGTNLGLCRFEAGRFECHDSEHLVGHDVHALAVAGDLLWVGTDHGLVSLRPGDGKVMEVRFSGTRVRALAAAKRNSLWIGAGTGLFRLEPDTGRVEQVELGSAEGPAVTVLLPDGDQVWIGTTAGLYLCDAEGRIRLAGREEFVRNDTMVTGLARTSGGVMFGTPRGLFRIGSDNGPVSRISGLANEIVRAVFRDREGLVWVGHDAGMSKLGPTRFLGFDRATGLLADFVRALAQDSQGRLWMGTRVGVQVAPVRAGRPVLDESFTVTRSDGLPNDRIYAIEFLGDGDALLATNGGVVRFDEQAGVVRTWTSVDGLPSDIIRSLRVGTRGNVWVGTDSGVAIIHDGVVSTGLPASLENTYTLDIREDSAGRFWFATRDHGLLVLAPDGTVEILDAGDGFSDQTLWDLADDGEGGMWVGTNGDGLFRIDAGRRVAVHLTEADGLADDFVWNVAVDDERRVWAYTTRGLSRYDGQRIINFDRNDGLLHLEGGATGALHDRDGHLWFSSVGGLVRFVSDDSGITGGPPPVVIERVESGGTRVSAGDRIPHNHDELTFEFAGLSFRQEDRMRYRYRLEGVSSDWTEQTGYRPVTYARLPPGDYEFQVLAADREGVWSAEPARFAFVVATPFWAQWWFMVASVVALAMLVIAIATLRMRELRRQKARLELLVGERTRDLETVNRRLRRAATTDSLTGLKNRRYLLEQIEHDVAHCRRRYRREKNPANATLTFLLIDLDGFKHINDEFGHKVGDLVLTRIGERLLAAARRADYVIRWGGDEFLVVARHSEPASGFRLAERILRILQDEVFRVNDHEQVRGCAASIGICNYPFAEHDPETLNWEQVIDIADAAAYMGKNRGGGCWVSIEATRVTAGVTAQDFLLQVRTRPEALEAAGKIRIRTSCPDSPG